MIYSLLVVIAVVCSVSAKLFTHDAAQQGKLWADFKKEHGRSYASAKEEAQRFGHFLDNLKLADARNEAQTLTGGAAIHGITKFFDSAMVKGAEVAVATTAAKAAYQPTSSVQTLSLVDWTGTYTTPVNDEGYCSGSWAFSAVQQIESDAMRMINGFSQPLSAEQVIQCTASMNTCNGGNVGDAYTYVGDRAGGIAPASAYPYSSYYSSGNAGTCTASRTTYTVSLKSSTKIVSSHSASAEQNMASYVQTTGPISVCLVTSPWMSSYTGGIVTSCGNDNKVDACAQIVGVDTSGDQPYWKIRGSWGTSWGEQGFFRLAYGTNACQITNYPTYTAVKSY